MTPSKDTIYYTINDLFVDALKRNNVPWIRPFNRKTLPFNGFTNKPFRSVNLFLLNLKSYNDPRFLTYNQAKELGGYIEPQSEKHVSTFWNFKLFDKSNGKEITEDQAAVMPDEAIRKQATLTGYQLYNQQNFVGIAQKRVDPINNPSSTGIILRDDDEWPDQEPTETYVSKFDEKRFNMSYAQRIIDQMPNRPEIIEVNHKPATYNRLSDIVHMPKLELFDKPSEYYAYMFKLLVASTSHQYRCNRYYKQDKHYAYCYEHLISSMGAAILCGHVHIEPFVPANLNNLVRDWISMTGGNSSLFLDAAQKAQKAVDYILKY